MSSGPAKLKGVHQRMVFDHLRRGGSASRAELAKATGLSAPTIGKVAQTLIEARLVEEQGLNGAGATPSPDPSLAEGGGKRTGRIDDGRDGHPTGLSGQALTYGSGGIGRPGTPLCLNRTAADIVALQLGVRRTRLARLPVAGPIEDDRWTTQFATPRTAKTWLERLRAAKRKLRLARPRVVMVSTPGVVDEVAGRVLLSPNLHWTEGVDLVKRLRDMWRCPVLLVQEIRALALGHLGATPNGQDFLLVDFGEGVGGAAVINGRLYEGALALSGELGHTPVLGNSRVCGCGAIGCVETLVSRRGLVKTFAAATGRRRATWRQLVRRVAEYDLEPWLQEALQAAGVTIGCAINVLGIQRIVVTGAITELPEAAVEYLSQAVQHSAMWARFGTVICVPAPRRWAAGLITAAIDRLLLPAQAWPNHVGYVPG